MIKGELLGWMTHCTSSVVRIVLQVTSPLTAGPVLTKLYRNVPDLVLFKFLKIKWFHSLARFQSYSTEMFLCWTITILTSVILVKQNFKLMDNFENRFQSSRTELCSMFRSYSKDKLISV